MSIISRTTGLASLLVLAAGPAAAQGSSQRDDLAAFRQAARGEVRHVIRLQPQRDENAFRVGVVIGRTMWVDCNQTSLTATLEERTAEGWGFSYYVATRVGPGITTRMACPSNTRTQRFVRNAEEPLLRYNSRLPLVVYAPSDVEVRYRVWRAGPESTAR